MSSSLVIAKHISLRWSFFLKLSFLSIDIRLLWSQKDNRLNLSIFHG